MLATLLVGAGCALEDDGLAGPTGGPDAGSPDLTATIGAEARPAAPGPTPSESRRDASLGLDVAVSADAGLRDAAVLDAGGPGPSDKLDAGIVSDAGGDGGTTLTFVAPHVFELPIGSIRYAVSGHDPASGLCFSLIWYVTSADETRFCGLGEPLSPYVWIEAADEPGCWNYAGNAMPVAADGCVEFGPIGSPGAFSADIEVEVKSDLWSGRLHFVSP